jgi:phosphatidylethanolamine-binding protein (PEBP) family uncharacterized protein
MHRRILSLSGAVVLVVVMGSACSSGNDVSTTASSTTTTSAPATSTAPSTATTFTLTSSAFTDGGTIPTTYACKGDGGVGVSLPLAWTGTPKAATTMALVIHDPDAPRPGGFTHLVTTFPASTTAFAEGASTDGGPLQKWIPPCPPAGPAHHYQFTVYAFGPDVTVAPDADKAAVEAQAAQALGTAKLTGLFAKP